MNKASVIQVSKKIRAAQEDARQSPIGFFNLGLSYLDSADELFRRHSHHEDRFSLAFDDPVRHLYAHSWELCLKACIFRQGAPPSEIKATIGHSLTKAWDLVDKERFAILALDAETRVLTEGLDRYHGARWYAYPITGYRREFTLAYLQACSQRLRLSRRQLIQLFIQDREELPSS